MDNSEGIRTVWLALAAMAVTSLIQIFIVLWSGSVALLADTLHNIGDGLNSIPLLIAFYLARRVAIRRYTYGFGRAEDVASIFIVLSIAVSAGIIFWESIQKFIYPQPITHLSWMAAAAIVGFVGNEAVALLQIRVGRKIGSAALVTDGLTSLAVLLAVVWTWLGFPILDPVISTILALFWLWMGVVYHLIFFTAINPLAYAFGGLFILQGLLLLVSGTFRRKLSFGPTPDVYGWVGGFFILYGLLIYPLLGYFMGHVYPHSPTFGLPCPTTIFTFGLLLWTDKRVPKYLLIIPVIWSFIGFGAALQWNVLEDIMLLITGLAATAMLVYRDRAGKLTPSLSRPV